MRLGEKGEFWTIFYHFDNFGKAKSKFSNEFSEYNPKNRTNFRNIIQKVCVFQKNVVPLQSQISIIYDHVSTGLTVTHS